MEDTFQRLVWACGQGLHLRRQKWLWFPIKSQAIPCHPMWALGSLESRPHSGAPPRLHPESQAWIWGVHPAYHHVFIPKPCARRTGSKRFDFQNPSLGITERESIAHWSESLREDHSSPFILQLRPEKKVTCPRSQLFSGKQKRAVACQVGAPNSRTSEVRQVTEMRGDKRDSAGDGESKPSGHQMGGTRGTSHLQEGGIWQPG